METITRILSQVGWKEMKMKGKQPRGEGGLIGYIKDIEEPKPKDPATTQNRQG